jgi:hypothetical protein
MRGHRLFIRGLIFAALAAIVFAGCGGSDSSTDSAKSEPSAEFFLAGKNVSGDVTYFVKFGHESNATEREAAGKVLAKNLAARGAEDWDGQCATLSKHAKNGEVTDQAKFATGHKLPCPATLTKSSEVAPKYVLADTLEGRRISALRIEGNEGVALYHGKNKNYAMPMRKENGVWKVDRLTTYPLPIPPKYR